MKRQVSVNLLDEGFEVSVNKEKYILKYPKEIWNSFPQSLRLPYAEFVAFMVTLPFAFNKNVNVHYDFPVPLGEPFFMYGLLMAMSENLVDLLDQKYKTSEFIKIAHNSFYKRTFSAIPRAATPINPVYVPVQKMALIPFSLGKDSLLTYALCKELEIKPILIFMLEPKNIHENRYKKERIAQFEKEFNEKVHIFETPFAALKRDGELSWGWDLLLTQYSIYMIPFLHFFKPQYLFWSNERNCSQAFPDDEGFLVNATFDQSGRWLQTLNTMLRLFSCNTQLGSILESVTQIADFYLLHKRYPTLGKYYVTCQGEDSKKVWCGRCDDCATFFLFFKAFEFDPKIAGLVDDMFATKKIKYLKCFNHQDEKQRMWMQFWKYHKQEKELALEICLQKKMKSPLLSAYQEYKKKNAHSNYNRLKKEYLSLHQSTTTQPELQKELFAIFEGELSKLRREI